MKHFIIATLLFSLASAAPAAPAVTPPAELEKRQSSNVQIEGVGISPASAARVRSSFTASGVVPTLIPSIVPVAAIKATFGTKQVDLGNQFTSLGDKSTQAYSLFLVYPDVPGPNGLPVVGQPRVNFLHWYVSGVGGANKQTTTVFETPTPVSPGDQHRYTFLVYREPAGYKPNVIGAQVRPAFDLLGYTKKGGLGQPVAGNFFNERISNGVIPS
ncbi:hypothetical protein DOTSEDRAFT_28021 [Dothistroma septosporum NZE10]|uniref:PEBP-like protein n=1 Tax=Dothistroma septosporum (strain NZE10 / CBS 128990) TaxID=675120 RepID=N1PFN3_DOTSN|nr:hypothetical protein DOTSEDRAFT_28021 [Dothistroma septosporum NZE10]